MGKFKIVTQEVKEQYQAKVNAIILAAGPTVQAINGALLMYGDTHYNFSKGRYALDYSIEKKAGLKADAINAYKSYLTEVIVKLEKLRDEYVKDVQAMDSTVDPVELDLIARELSVMNDKELREFMEEYIGDTNKMRLLKVEVKKRKQSGQDALILGEVTYDDSITDLINSTIKTYSAYRSVSETTIYLPVEEEGNGYRMCNGHWDHIIRRLEYKTRDDIVRVNIKNFIN